MIQEIYLVVIRDKHDRTKDRDRLDRNDKERSREKYRYERERSERDKRDRDRIRERDSYSNKERREEKPIDRFNFPWEVKERTKRSIQSSIKW